MLIGLILLCLIIGLLVGLPILVVRIYGSARLKRWQKHLISFSAIGGGLFIIVAIIAGAFTQSVTYAFSGHDLPKNSKEVRSYLKDIGIGIEFPAFKVDEHRFVFTGGDDTEEYWEITFKEPLPKVFLEKLDSLCRVDARWRHYDKYVGHGMASDVIPCYEFLYWNPEQIEIRETVTIYPGRRAATLSHVKI